MCEGRTIELSAVVWTESIIAPMGPWELVQTWLWFTMLGLLGSVVVAGLAYAVYKTR